MSKESLRQLAADFKNFLAAQSEDDLIVAAAPMPAAAAVLPKTTPQPQAVEISQETEVAQKTQNVQPVTMQPQAAMAVDTLTVQFRREVKPAAAAPQTLMTTAQKTKALAELAQTIENCSRCPLGSTRINAVPGEGNVDADVMFVGEGPGYDEDRQGRPFVGRAGQLLDKMIIAMGLSREKVFIANIAKCHPMTDPLHPEKHGNDRAPNAGEIACCRRYIEKQISIICPKYVIALGSVAARALISDAKSLGALRGQFFNLRLDSVTLPKPVQIIATYHPAALLRNPNWKKDAWADLQLVMDKLGLKGARK